MAGLAFLEQFDEAPAPTPDDTPVEQQPGYKQGFDDGVELERSKQTALQADLIEKLSEVSFSYSEAKQSTLSALEPLLHALVDLVLPGLVPEVERALVLELIQSAATSDLDRPIVIKAHPSRTLALDTALSDVPDLLVEVHGDPSLKPSEIFVHGKQGETSLDTAALIASIQQALSVTFASTERAYANG